MNTKETERRSVTFIDFLKILKNKDTTRCNSFFDDLPEYLSVNFVFFYFKWRDIIAHNKQDFYDEILKHNIQDNVPKFDSEIVKEYREVYTIGYKDIFMDITGSDKELVVELYKSLDTDKKELVTPLIICLKEFEDLIPRHSRYKISANTINYKDWLRQFSASLSLMIGGSLYEAIMATRFLVPSAAPKEENQCVFQVGSGRELVVVMSQDGKTKLPGLGQTKYGVPMFETYYKYKLGYGELLNGLEVGLPEVVEAIYRGMQERMNLSFLSLIDSVSDIYNPVATMDSCVLVEKDVEDIRKHMMESYDVVPYAVLMSADDKDEIVGLFPELVYDEWKKGRDCSKYLGAKYGLEFYGVDLIASGVMYVLPPPNYLGWFPIQNWFEIIPFIDHTKGELGFMGYNVSGMAVFKPEGVMKIEKTKEGALVPYGEEQEKLRVITNDLLVEGKEIDIEELRKKMLEKLKVQNGYDEKLEKYYKEV